MQNSSKNKVINLKLHTIGLPKHDENKISKNLVVPGYYGRLPPGAGNLAWSIYKMLLREKTIKRHKMMLSQKQTILNDYTNGMNLKILVEKYDFPPSLILRMILRYHYHIRRDTTIKEILKGNKKLIEKYDLSATDINFALANDIIANVDQSIASNRANDYEEYIANFLTNHNISFITQTQIIEAAKKKGITPKATPDFLFISKVYINGERVYWMDAKHSYGMALPIIKESLKKQMTKYINLWGKGVVVFSAGFSENLKLSNVIFGTILFDTSS
jgi:hypothetical protein